MVDGSRRLLMKLKKNKRSFVPFSILLTVLVIFSIFYNIPKVKSVSNGNVFIAVIGISGSSNPTVSSISQTGVTWTKQISKLYSANQLDIEIWYGISTVNNPSMVVSIILSDVANYAGIADILGYSGLATTSFLDKTASATGESIYPSTGTTVTTTQANELFVGGIIVDTKSQSSPTNGFTLIDGSLYVYESVAYLEKIVSSTGTASCNTTIGSTAYCWDGCIVTLKANSTITRLGNARGTSQSSTISVTVTFGSSGSSGSITFDAAAHTSNYPANSWNHTIGSNANLILIAVETTHGASGVSIGTQSAILLRSDVYSGYICQIWYLINPTSGSKTVTISSSYDLIGGSCSYCGVDTTNPFCSSATNSGTGTIVNCSIPLVGTNVWTFQAITSQTYHNNVVSATPNSNQTMRWQGAPADDVLSGDGADKNESTTGNKLEQYTLSSSADWIIDVVAIVPKENQPPTNDALTLDLTGANYKGAKTLLTAKQDYKFVYKCSDADGVTDITYGEIRLDYSSKNVILRATRGTGDSWTFSEQSDPSNYVTLGTCSDSTSGTQKTFNFYVKINWAWGDSSETVGVRGYVIDSQSASDQDDYSNIFGVECHLASSSLTINDYRVNPSQTLTMSGYWYYNTTAVFPPDGDYQVKIKFSGTQKGSTDTTLVSGAFSISDVTAESTVNSYTYQVFANYNASAGNFNAVVVDKARVYYEQLDDSRVNINANIEFRIKAILLYDNHALGTGDTVTANFGSLTWDAGNSWFDGSRTQATVGSYVFQISSLSEATYGITSFEINVTDPTGVYDRIRIDSISVVDGRININTEGSFYATASLEFDNHALGTGDALSLSGHSFSWVSSRSRFEYNTTQSSVLHVTIDSFTSGSEATYGITVGNINSKSAFIIWDRIHVSFVANSTGPVLNQVVLFTVVLTREYDSSSVTSYSYNINRNGSAFGNPHSTATFTDVHSSQITYVYDFISIMDNSYNLTAFVDPSDITVKWTSTNHAPTFDDFNAPADVYAGQYIFINATVDDADGRTEIANATVELNGNVILKWLNVLNTFSIQSDPNNYVTLNESACLRTILNATAYLLSWNLKFAWNYPYETPSIILTNTKVYDIYSSYGSNSKSNLFSFKDDLIVASANVTPTETTPETNVVFNGTLYYYNTTIPPYITTGMTVYLELNGLLQGATTTVSSSGAWTKIMRCPATTGNKTYIVYVMTDEIGVANKTVNLFVMSTGSTGGGGYFLPSTPVYRPENYTYTAPISATEEVAVPTGLEGLGLNILIIAIVAATVLGVGASVIKPSRPTLASKIHVKRASSTDYKKRLRRPKRKGA